MIGRCCSGLIAASTSVNPNPDPDQKCDGCGAGAVTVMASVDEVGVMTGSVLARTAPRKPGASGKIVTYQHPKYRGRGMTASSAGPLRPEVICASLGRANFNGPAPFSLP